MIVRPRYRFIPKQRNELPLKPPWITIVMQSCCKAAIRGPSHSNSGARAPVPMAPARVFSRTWEHFGGSCRR